MQDTEMKTNGNMEALDEEDDWNPSEQSKQQQSQMASLLNPQIINYKDQLLKISDSSAVIAQKKKKHHQAKQDLSDQEEEDEDMMNTSQDKDECPFEMKAQHKHINRKNETYDDLLYNPCEDELNANWINKLQSHHSHQQKLNAQDSKELLQISCSKCFTIISYTAISQKAQKHQIKSDYQSRSAQNITLDESQILRSKKKNYESDQKFEMFYFKVKCNGCDEEIAIYDDESKTYYFFDVVPNYIG
eukprot:403365876